MKILNHPNIGKYFSTIIIQNQNSALIKEKIDE